MSDILEVDYATNVTPLFAAIESSEWKEALKIIWSDDSEKSNQVRTWVVSKGSKGTTFGWSVWRRLPLHEACRRQPPEEVVDALLTIFPKSPRMKTHFGELPIHVACSSGASTAIVNMLIGINPNSVINKDNSGRTPYEIVTDSMMPNRDAVVRILKRCELIILEDKQLTQEQLKNAKASTSDLQMKIDFMKHERLLQESSVKKTVTQMEYLKKAMKAMISDQKKISELMDEHERHVQAAATTKKQINEVIAHQNKILEVTLNKIGIDDSDHKDS